MFVWCRLTGIVCWVWSWARRRAIWSNRPSMFIWSCVMDLTIYRRRISRLFRVCPQISCWNNPYRMEIKCPMTWTKRPCWINRPLCNKTALDLQLMDTYWTRVDSWTTTTTTILTTIRRVITIICETLKRRVNATRPVIIYRLYRRLHLTICSSSPNMVQRRTVK